MDVGAALKSFIYLISSSLLYPTLLLLSAFAVWMLVRVGVCAARWFERSRLDRPTADKLVELAEQNCVEQRLPHDVCAYMERLRSQAMQSDLREVIAENLLQEHCAATSQTLVPLRILVRVGPGLGLIGTLIPMGTGLAALGQGDVTKLSSDLVIAFTTTVVGLALGLVAYVLYTVERRWVDQDVRDAEFVTEILVANTAASQQDYTNEVHEETPARGV